MNSPEISSSAATVAPRQFAAVLELMKYFGASALALVADAGVLAAGTRLGVPYATAAAIAFLTGLAVAYVLSIRWVFEARRVGNASVEFAIFAGIGVAGLGLTELVLWGVVEHLHGGLAFAKLCSAGLVFFFNFGVRKAWLFRKHGR